MMMRERAPLPPSHSTTLLYALICLINIYLLEMSVEEAGNGVSMEIPEQVKTENVALVLQEKNSSAKFVSTSIRCCHKAVR